MKWIKIIILFCTVLVIGCRKVYVEPTPPPSTTDIFSVKEISVTNEQPLVFSLKSDGLYTLTLFDSTAQQVVMRERINGKSGVNSFKLYTKSLSVKYLYMILENESGSEIGKTLLVIN